MLAGQSEQLEPLTLVLFGTMLLPAELSGPEEVPK